MARTFKLKQRYFHCCVISVAICILLYLRTFHSMAVFGSQNVTVASSLDLNSWLSLNSQSCDYHEIRNLKFRHLDVKLVCTKQSKPCYIWYWDVANWTLIYTDQNMNTRPALLRKYCPIPIHGVRTAKIIQADGKVEYPGCTNDKYPCAPRSLSSATYDTDIKQRINRSPCCRKLLIEITQHVARVFDKFDITYFLVGGPVIGLVRDNGRFIPYDTDTDIAADVNDYEKIIRAFAELKKPGYIFKWMLQYTKGLERYLIGCTNEHCENGPGIALYHREGDLIVAPVTGWPSLPVNLTIPPIRREFEGMEMAFPREPEKYLDYNYGRDKWRRPLTCTKHYYSQCSE